MGRALQREPGWVSQQAGVGNQTNPLALRGPGEPTAPQCKWIPLGFSLGVPSASQGCPSDFSPAEPACDLLPRPRRGPFPQMLEGA